MKEISVIVTCFNYGKYLRECIGSIENQTYPNNQIETIIVDDGSTDIDTIKILRVLSEQYKVIVLPSNKGLGYASNVGIGAASGTFIMRVDADDYLHPQHIEKLLEIKGKQNFFVYSDFWNVYSKNGKLEVGLQPGIPHNSCAIYPKALWVKIGGYRTDIRYQDQVDFYNKIKNITTLYHICEPTWYCRKHEKQMSNNHNAKMKVRENILDHKKVLVVIPARGNSKDVPRKNLRKVGSLTLLERAIKMVKDSNITAQIVVSTEDHEIYNVAKNDHGVDRLIWRPKELSEDDVSTIPVVKHAMEHISSDKWRPEIIISVQTTCPFTPPKALAEGLKKLINNPDLDSIVSISKVKKHPWRTYQKYGKLNYLNPIFSKSCSDTLQRQDRVEAYGFTGGFYIRRRYLLDNWNEKDFALGECAGIEVGQIAAIDIDTEEDLLIAQALDRGGELKCN